MQAKGTGVMPAPQLLTDIETATIGFGAITGFNAVSLAHIRLSWQKLCSYKAVAVYPFCSSILKLFGARVIATTSADENLEPIKSLVVDVVFNDNETPDWVRRSVEIMNGRGANLVVEIEGWKHSED